MSTILLLSKTSSRSRRDKVLILTLRFAAIATIALLFSIVTFLAFEAWPAVTEIGIGRFFFDSSWHPTHNAFNLTPMLVGTLLTTAVALALALPLSVAIAIFSAFLAPSPIALGCRQMMIVLAGTPSVVLGFWGLVSLVPLVNQLHPPGASLLAGACVLAIMITPTATLLIDAAFRSFPQEQSQAAESLGLSKSTFVIGVILPAQADAIYAAFALAMLRALGETMAVLMVAGNVPTLPSSLFDPVRTLTANIALEMAYAVDVHRATLYVSGLLLLAAVIPIAFYLNRKETRLTML